MITAKQFPRMARNLKRKSILLRDGIGLLKRLSAAVTRNVMGTVTHVETQDPVAALTFDDGPHPEYTPRLLNILERHRARATFFMIGEVAQKHPELVRQIAKAGHAIGNHSWDHPSFPLITRRERRAQIRACERAISPYGQGLFRPPYGQQSPASRLDALLLGQKVIMFNCEVGDWFDPDAERMADTLVAKLRPGSIIVLHDAVRWDPAPGRRPRFDHEPKVGRESMLAALELFLGRMGRQFRFLTIPQLLHQGRAGLKIWYTVTPPGQ